MRGRPSMRCASAEPPANRSWRCARTSTRVEPATSGRGNRSLRAGSAASHRSKSSRPAAPGSVTPPAWSSSQANGRVGQQGAVADYLEVDRRYERAVEACLGDLLQHVIVERHKQADAGLSAGARAQRRPLRLRRRSSPGSTPIQIRARRRVPGHPCRDADVVRVAVRTRGRFSRSFPTRAWPTRSSRPSGSPSDVSPVATPEGEVVRGPHLVSGGAKVESRSILATRREIKELRERVAIDRAALEARCTRPRSSS